MSTVLVKTSIATLILLGIATVSGTAVAQEAAQPKVTHVALVHTTAGDIEIQLYGQDAPKTVKNFVELARKGYFDGIAFHRIIPGFVIQGGDPYSRDSVNRGVWGQGGTSIYGGTFVDELDARSPSGAMGYREGVVAMANRGRNTNSSQFFVVLSDEAQSRFQYKYTIFGRVSRGMDIVQKIASAQVDPAWPGRNIPKSPVTILGITVTDRTK